MVQQTNKTKRTMRFIQACADEYMEQFLWSFPDFGIVPLGDGTYLVKAPFVNLVRIDDLTRGGEVGNAAGS